MTPFDVVLVPFPFADLRSSKRRPCLVLSGFKPRGLREHVIVAMITSQLSGPRFPFDVELEKYQAAGLPKPSLVRLGKIVTLDSSLIVKQLGTLTAADKRLVKAEFEKLFKGLS